MFKKTELLHSILSVCIMALLILILYLITGSLLAGIVVAIIFSLYGKCADLSRKGMYKMMDDEIYATRNGLPKGAMRGKALLHASMVLSPFYFLYMLPTFIPVRSLYAWAMVQFGFIILAPLNLRAVGSVYRNITCCRKPFWITQAVIFLLLTLLSFIIRNAFLELLS